MIKFFLLIIWAGMLKSYMKTNGAGYPAPFLKFPVTDLVVFFSVFSEEIIVASA